MSENEVKNENMQPEEVKPEEATCASDSTDVNVQSDAYFEAMCRLEEEKKVAKKKKKKKRLLIILGVVVAIVLFVMVKNAISNSITFGEQVDRVSAAVAAEEFNSDEFKDAVHNLNVNPDYSDSKKAKKFFVLGKEAIEAKNLNCYEELFNNCIEKDEDYKEKVAKEIKSAIQSAEDYVAFFDYAAYCSTLGESLDDESVAKAKTYLSESIAIGKFSDYEKMLAVCEAVGVKGDDATNAKVYAVAMEAYNAQNYPEAYNWFGAYSGKEDIKSAKQETTYEYVIQVLFGEIIELDIDDEFEWAKELLSTEEMKNYKQSEGIRLYCNLADAALKSYRNSQNKNAQDDYVKSKLMFPDSYRFLGKSVTSDFYMKKADEEDKAKICYDCTIAYTAMNKYGYTVTDTYNVINSQSFSLNGSDYLLAVKIFNNFSNENMLKYARTGEFTNTKVTFEY